MKISARRHPADVTAHRLLEHTIKYRGRFEGRELDAIGEVRYALQRIADEDLAANDADA
jgi:hypothetical protein